MRNDYIDYQSVHDAPEMVEKMSLHPFTLSFSGERERKYFEGFFENSISQVRVIIILATCLYGIFYILDLILVPGQKTAFMIIRFGIIIPFMLSVFLFSYYRLYKSIWQMVSFFTIIIGGIGIILMLLIAPNNYTYFGGIMLVLMTGFFAKLRFYLSTIAGLIIISIFNILAIYFSDILPKYIINNNFFLISANLIGMLAAYNIEYYARRDYFQNDILNQRKEAVETANIILEQKALLSMMNPHFIFNTLGSIQSFMLQEKPTESAYYLSQFSRLIRQNLQAIKTGRISIEEEISTIKDYLELERLRFQKKFDYEIFLGEGIEKDEMMIPSMILQPIVENAILHGFSFLDGKGMIFIGLEKHSENALKVIIRDNGVGIDKTSKQNSQTGKDLHLGIDLTFSRLGIIGRNMNIPTQAEIYEVNPLSPNPGTEVRMIVPLT